MRVRTGFFFLCSFFAFSGQAQQTGLKATYYLGRNFAKPVSERIDPRFDFVWDVSGPAAGMDRSEFSARWTGWLKAPVSGTYTFLLKVDDGFRLRVGNVPVFNVWQDNNHQKYSRKIKLEAGKGYKIEAEYYNGILEGELHLEWILPPEAPADIRKSWNGIIPSEAFLQSPPPVLNPAIGPVINSQVPLSGSQEAANLQRLLKNCTQSTLFKLSTAEILPSSHGNLEKLASLLKQYGGLKIKLFGHTDIDGDSLQNISLSEDRAEAIAEFLMDKGISAERIQTQGFGSRFPLVRSGTKEQRAVNRRVEFKIEYP